MNFSLRISAAIALPFLLSACASNTPAHIQENATAPVLISEPESETTFKNPVSPNTQAVDATHGKVIGLSIGAIEGVNGTLANGVATVYFFEDKGSIAGLQLNIAAAEKGTFYMATLQSSSSTEKLPIGRLENRTNDVRHSLRFDTTADLRKYTTVIITLEEEKGGSAAGTVVAKAVLKATK